VTDIREILRRLHLGEPERRIARDLGISRNTVAHYRLWAARHGVLDGRSAAEAAPLAALLERAPAERPAHEQSLVEPLRERVLALHARGVEGQAIWQLLVEEHGFTGSYSSVKRFLRRVAPTTAAATVRIEVEPGEEAQVDFGFAGQFLDPDRGRVRRAWVFVMTLSCSRHQYAELVFDQTVATWLRLHRGGVRVFRRVSRRVVLDNSAPPSSTPRSTIPRSSAATASASSTTASSSRPVAPERLSTKGKVEQGGVHYVKRNALAGRAFRDLHDGNRHLLRWCVETAGRRIHDTTKRGPLEVFEDRERATLQPLPLTPWERVEWKGAKLHVDCHVVFAGAYYSAPPIASSASASGCRPPSARSNSFTITRWSPPIDPRGPASAARLPRISRRSRSTSSCRRPRGVGRRPPRSAVLCPVYLFIEALLGDRPLDRLRGAQGVLRLAQRYGPPPRRRLCPRPRGRRVSLPHRQTILVHALDQQPLPELVPVVVAPASSPPRHARPWTTFFPDPGAEDRRSTVWN
jgi:transposase